MKALLFAGAAAVVAAFAFSAPAAAQNGPWCAHYDFGNDESVNCGFVDFRQCVADVRGIGGFCVQNPTYGLARPHGWRRSWYR